MCTLTYLLTPSGYELFFNRDEQRTRASALFPSFNATHKAIYPVDPQGNGTWLAVNHQGTSLALLNYYHASHSAATEKTRSRGQLILALIEQQHDALTLLNTMDLTVYQPFQLCIFPKNLSLNTNNVISVKWNGEELITEQITKTEQLPITSSSVDFPTVQAKRQQRFREITQHAISRKSLEKYHYSQEDEGKNAVNMSRKDAMSVSISHLIIGEDIQYDYHDNVLNKKTTITIERVS